MSSPRSLATASASALPTGPWLASSLEVEGPELVARQLVARPARHLGRLDRPRPQHREILQHHLQVRIGLHELGDVGERTFAEVAIVVEEFDQRGGRLRVADRRLVFGAEQWARLGSPTVFWRSASAVALSRLSSASIASRRDVGIVDEIIVDECAQLLLLRRGELVARARQRGDRWTAPRREPATKARAAINLIDLSSLQRRAVSRRTPPIARF